jgi:hypothetical protein
MQQHSSRTCVWSIYLSVDTVFQSLWCSPLWNICVTNDHGYVPLVVSTSRFFPRSWLITGFVTRLTRRVSLVEQELLTLPEHMSSPLVFNGVRVTRSLVLCVCFVNRPFVLFLLAIVLFVLLRYADSNYHFGIFKLFFNNFRNSYKHLKKKYFIKSTCSNVVLNLKLMNCSVLTFAIENR